jgi:hypothetical protein
MIHPLFRLLVSEPQMLAEHVEGYAELVAEEVGAATERLKRRVLLHAVSVVAILVAVLLASMALLLWAAIPLENMRAPWVLLAAPTAPALLAAWAHFAAQARSPNSDGLSAIREQLAADAAMLKSVTQP